MDDSNYKMYIFVNSELKMSSGKIAAQVGHGVQKVVDDIFTNYFDGVKKYKKFYKDYLIWNQYHGSAKIVLKATLTELEYLRTLSYSKYVIDAGKTQIEPNSLTVVVLFPIDCKTTTLDLSKYKLL